MDRFTEGFKVLVGGAITAVSGFLGGMDGIMYALIAFITIDYITGIAVAVKRRELSSEELADTLRRIKTGGKSSACFLIGSSFGIDPSVKAMADLRLSVSKMTFPHHLFRVMLLEQIYRAESIQAGTKYHK